MRYLFTVVIMVFALALVGQNLWAQANYDTLSIYDLQYVPNPDSSDISLYYGDTVVVKGLVMNYPRDLWVGARWAVYIVDPDSFPNPWSGFFIIQQDTSEIQTNFGFVEPGMICYFTGLVDEYSNFSQVNIYGQNFIPPQPIPVDIVSTGNPLPSPVVLTAADLADRADAEKWESMWARIEDATVVNNAISGNWASITDATGQQTFIAEYFNWFRDRLNAGTYDWPANGTNLNVDGFTRDESGGPGQVFTINPRDTFDLEILTNPPVIGDVTRDPGVPSSSDDVTVTTTIVDNGTVANAYVNYSVNWGSFQQLSMTANQDTFQATIPLQSDGDFVRYFVEAVDNDGETSIMPGDTSMASGSIFFYIVRDGLLNIRDVQYTYGYASDRSGYAGYQVTLQGVVMSDSTDFFGDYWIQEADSAWSGIWVNDGTFTHVKGDLVEVTGEVEENYGVTRIDNVTQSTVVTAGVGEFSPVNATTGELTTGGANAEAYESVLIRVQNLTVTDPFPDDPSNFGEFEVDDGSGGLRVDDLSDAFIGNLDSTYGMGDHIDEIIAFQYFSFGNNKIIPRDTLDVIGHSVGIGDIAQVAPDKFTLKQNYPNPFNPSTTISYQVPRSGEFSLVIYNVLGQKVRQLVNGPHTTGLHQVQWNGRDDFGNRVGSGIYFYRLTGDGVSLVKKMILMK